MTADKVDVGALEALLAKATPGEWKTVMVRPAEIQCGPLVIGHVFGSSNCRDLPKATNATLIAAAVNALPELLRVYRAWQGAAVVEIDGSGEEVRLIGFGSELDNSIASARIDAMHGTRVRLVPDGGQGA